MNKNKVMIGLEIHIPLNTQSKLFCSCPTSPNKPNTNTCEICLGYPGSKPQLNKQAVVKAIQLALAIDCKIPKQSKFTRKTYFYPDLTKNFQITQLEQPIATKGTVNLINITRLQIEEDPGSLIHKEDHCLIDYNRAGFPLIEMVTEPEFISAKQVTEFLQKLSRILDYLNLHNPKISSLRTDINISTNGSKRVEIKNVSGTKAIEKAINFEIIRQKLKIKKGQTIEQETMHFDAEIGKTFRSRSKETEQDYGYILEPDLPTLHLEKDFITKIKKDLPELPEKRQKRFKQEYKLSEEDAQTITKEKCIADLFENLKTNKEQLKKWIVGPLKKVLNYNKIRFIDTRITKQQVLDLLKKIEDKQLTPRSGEFVLRKLVESPQDINKIIKKLGFQGINEKELKKIIKEILKENPKAIKDYKKGEKKSLQFLIGQVIRKTQGQSNAVKVKELILKEL